MATNVTLRRNVVIGSTTYGENRIVTVDAPVILQETINDATTDKQLIFAVDYSQLQLVYLHSTRALTLETVSPSSPTDTIALAANVGRLWYSGESSCPFTADCTNIYATNSSGAAAVLTMIIAYDATP